MCYVHFKRSPSPYVWIHFCIRCSTASLDGKELIMHDARMDLQILGEFGLRDAKIFDTQIAYMMINCGPRIGLGDLLKELLGVAVDKSQQTSDWYVSHGRHILIN